MVQTGLGLGDHHNLPKPLFRSHASMTSGLPTTPVVPEHVRFCRSADVIGVSRSRNVSSGEMRGKKRGRESEKEGIRKSQGRKNWSEGDSILPAYAHSWIEENKNRTNASMLQTRYPKAREAKDRLNQGNLCALPLSSSQGASLT